jgi:polyisoprenoid-binding protein YceI
LTVDGQLTVRGVSRPQMLTATVAEVTPDAITLTAKFDVDRTQFGMSWNQMGMLRGPATMTATLRFARR